MLHLEFWSRNLYPYPSLWFSTLRCRGFGRESVSPSETNLRESFDSISLIGLRGTRSRIVLRGIFRLYWSFTTHSISFYKMFCSRLPRRGKEEKTRKTKTKKTTTMKTHLIGGLATTRRSRTQSEKPRKRRIPSRPAAAPRRRAKTPRSPRRRSVRRPFRGSRYGSGAWALAYAFLPCGHLDFESAVTAQNGEFKGNFHGSYSRLLSVTQNLAKKHLASMLSDTFAT